MTDIKLVHVDSLSCEAILRKTPNGELIIVGQNGGKKEPDIDNRVYVFHSKDDGDTWSKPHLIIADNKKAVYCTEVSIIEKKIYAFLTLHNGYFLNYSNIVVVSEDNGYTWHIDDSFPSLDGFVFVRGMIQLKNGDYVFPYQQYLVSKEENNELVNKKLYIWNSAIETVYNGVFIKNKHSNEYTFSNKIEIPLFKHNKKLWQWTEPTIAQLSDESLVMLLRVNQSGYLYESRSYDCGLTWSIAKKTTLKNPGNKPKLIMMDQGIALINTFSDGSTYRDRCPLSIWISNNDMRTWDYQKDVVRFPGWLSYPDGYYDKSTNAILFAFEFNRHDIYFVKHQIEEDLS